MASNGLAEASLGQNGNRRLPEGSLAETVPANLSTQNPKMSRKRTKTGCLTCRKRRIKCGEERPICSNCVKSKRNCEGYNQRVVFKDPMNAFRPTGTAVQHSSGNGASFDHVPMQGGPVSQYGRTRSASTTSQAPLPTIAPRPTYQDAPNGLDGLPVGIRYGSAPDYPFASYDPAQSGLPYPLGDLFSTQQQSYDSIYSTTDGNYTTLENQPLARPADSSTCTFPPGVSPTGGAGGLTHETTQLPPGAWPQSNGHYSQSSLQVTPPQDRYVQFPRQGNQPTPAVTTNGSLYSTQYRQLDDPQRTPTQRSPLEGNEFVMLDSADKPMHYSAQSVLQHSLQNGWLVNNGPHTDTSTTNGHASANGNINDSVPQQLYLRQKGSMEAMHAVPYDQSAAVEDPEDDYFDVDSDGDPEFGTCQKPHKFNDHTRDLGLMLAMSAAQDDGGLRSYTAFLNEPNVLATYRPTATASPLMDPQTARVFCHFVTSTGPSLSIYERHPTNPSVMFTGAPVPASQQALWTYTLPTLALNHQGLLHSMLALASLHIAKLQHTSPTPSLKHYHYALRRVARAVGLPSRRHEIATFAATLLLGFYEVMTAEHSKWNSHLAGARQLAMEIDFAGMTKRIKAMKQRSELNRKSQYYESLNGPGYPPYYNGYNHHEDLNLEQDKDIDESLVSTIMGMTVRYGELGHVVDESGAANPGTKPLTAKDLETYRIQSDLFWWYCKQDCYQSIVSGNRLLMPYDRWGHCPPRSPMGKLDAIYGTMDHLILLIGRVAEFGGKDQKRKREAIQANGGVWRPRPGLVPGGMFQGPPPGAPQSAPPTGTGVQPSMGFGNPVAQTQQNVGSSSQYAPPMYGMAPPPGTQRMPDAFVQGPTIGQAATTQCDPLELEAATVAAEAEWNDIKNAFQVFEDNLGPDFQPLSPEYMQPLSTPFGPAIYYRTYSMACIWALYYTGRIITARVHPSMPPAAMVAAGVAAFQTKDWARLIGRVCAGLQPTSAVTQLNPSLGAALIESSLCLFFAGIQYQDAGQRGWTITKLRDIARLTGWQSSAAIASGCETAWTKAADAGKGPPYQRTMDPTAKDDRVAGRRPDLNGGPPKDNNDRRFITMYAGTRVHWALGLLSVEEDMKKLTLEK